MANKKIPLGKPLNLSDEILDNLTSIEASTPDEKEIQELIIFWKRVVTVQSLINLLEAKIIENA